VIYIKAILLVLVNCILLVSGQILWKIGLRDLSFNGLKSIISILFNKYIFSGLVIYAVATFYWFYILKKYDLTKVYPIQSLSYVLALIFGYLILNENITKNSIIGTIIICIGVFIIAR